MAPNGVSNGRYKLPPKTKICTQLPGKLLRAVERVGEIPLKLVH